RRKIGGGRRRSDSTLHAGKRIHAPARPALAVDPLGVLLQPAQSIAELRSLKRLLQKIGSAQSHRPQQEFFVALRVRKDYVQLRHGLPEMLEGAQSLV